MAHAALKVALESPPAVAFAAKLDLPHPVFVAQSLDAIKSKHALGAACAALDHQLPQGRQADFWKMLEGRRLGVAESNRGETKAARVRDVAPLAFFLAHNTSCTELALSNNSIGPEGALCLAEALRINTTLKKLYMGWNRVGAAGAHHLASALSTNSTLQELGLQVNGLGDAGAWALAAGLAENSAVTFLDLYGNKVGATGATSLAAALKVNTALERIKGVDWAGVTTPPPEVCAQGLGTIRQYWRDLRASAAKNWALKVIVVGRGRAGKTSLVASLVAGRPALERFDARTIGIDTVEWAPAPATATAGATPQGAATPATAEPAAGDAATAPPPPLPPLRLQFWDFAGQHEYYVTHQFFLTRGALFVLVFDVSAMACDANDYKFHVEFWLDSVMQRVPAATLLLVATHADALPAEQLRERVAFVTQQVRATLADRRAGIEAAAAADGARGGGGGNDQERAAAASATAARRWAQAQRAHLPEVLEPVVAVSAAEYTGFVELRGRLVAAALDPARFPQVGADMPAAYLALQHRVLEAAQRRLDAGQVPVVEWARFRELVADCGFDDSPDGRASLAAATAFAHELGLLLHFRDDPRLGEHVILRPQWLVSVLKAVVRHDLYQPLRSPPVNLPDYRPELVDDAAAYPPARLEEDKRSFNGGAALLSRELLLYLWRWQGGDLRALPAATASLFFDLLCHFHLLYAVPPADAPGARRYFVVPSRLAEEPAPQQLAAHWPVPPPPTLRTRALEGVFEHHTPVGLFPRLLAALLPQLRSPLAVWARGIVAEWVPRREAADGGERRGGAHSDDGDEGGGGAVHVLVELTDTLYAGESRTTLRLVARHARPARSMAVLHALLCTVGDLAVEWAGLSLPFFARDPAALDAGVVLALAERAPLAPMLQLARSGASHWVTAAGARVPLEDVLPNAAPLLRAARRRQRREDEDAAAANGGEAGVAAGAPLAPSVRAAPAEDGGDMGDADAADAAVPADDDDDDGALGPAIQAALAALPAVVTHVATRALRPACEATAAGGGGAGEAGASLPPKRWRAGAPVDDAIALVIGVDAYASPALDRLTCAASDARRFAAVVSRFGFRVVAALADEQATKRNVEAALDLVAGLCPTYSPVRQLAVFFAGHGLRKPKPDGVTYEGYLCLHDTQPDRLTSTALSMTHLKAICDTLGAAQQLWVLDCCHAGEFLMGAQAGFVAAPAAGGAAAPRVGVGREDERAGGGDGHPQSLLRLELRQRAICGFAATSSEQQATELRAADGRGHGLFTACLCGALEDALAGAAGATATAVEDVEPEEARFVSRVVDVPQLCRAVAKAVHRASAATVATSGGGGGGGGARQLPVFGSLLSGPGSILWLLPAEDTRGAGDGGGGRLTAGDGSGETGSGDEASSRLNTAQPPGPAVAAAARSADSGAGATLVARPRSAAGAPEPGESPQARAVLALLAARAQRPVSVREALAAAGLERYAAAMEDAGVEDLATLFHVDDEVLAEVGMKTVHRKVFASVARAVKAALAQAGDGGDGDQVGSTTCCVS